MYLLKIMFCLDSPLDVTADLLGFFVRPTPLLLMLFIYIKWLYIIIALIHSFQLQLLHLLS